jgi:hypothetical protein
MTRSRAVCRSTSGAANWTRYGSQLSGSPAAGFPLIDNGYLIGRNLVFEERYAGGDNEKVPALIAELLALKVDVLVTVGTAVSLAARHATSTCRSSACGRFTDLAKGYVVTDPFSRYGEVNQTYRGHPFQRD